MRFGDSKVRDDEKLIASVCDKCGRLEVSERRLEKCPTCGCGCIDYIFNGPSLRTIMALQGQLEAAHKQMEAAKSTAEMAMRAFRRSMVAVKDLFDSVSATETTIAELDDDMNYELTSRVKIYDDKPMERFVRDTMAKADEEDL